MALKPIVVTEDSRAEEIARQIINNITNTAKRIIDLRGGAKAVEAQKITNQQSGEVREIPMQPAVSKEQIDAKLGAENVAILDALAKAME